MTKKIGYGSVSAFDSVRYDLYLDEDANIAFFEAWNRKFTIELQSETVQRVKQGKKLWFVLSQKTPRMIQENPEILANNLKEKDVVLIE